MNPKHLNSLILALCLVTLAACGDVLKGAKLTSAELKTELAAGCRDTAKLSPFMQESDCTCAADKVAASYPEGLKYESFSELASMMSGNHEVSKKFQAELAACMNSRKAGGKSSTQDAAPSVPPAAEPSDSSNSQPKSGAHTR
jgi:hypothetical protein